MTEKGDPEFNPQHSQEWPFPTQIGNSPWAQPDTRLRAKALQTKGTISSPHLALLPPKRSWGELDQSGGGGVTILIGTKCYSAYGAFLAGNKIKADNAVKIKPRGQEYLLISFRRGAYLAVLRAHSNSVLRHHSWQCWRNNKGFECQSTSDKASSFPTVHFLAPHLSSKNEMQWFLEGPTIIWVPRPLLFFVPEVRDKNFFEAEVSRCFWKEPEC